MEIVSTTGIILKSKTINEADISSSIFTQNRGLCRFIFKGLKKSKHRHRSAADPGTLIQMTYYRKEESEYSYASNFTVTNHILGSLSSYENSVNASLLLELILKSSAPHMANPFLFTMLYRALVQIVETNHPYHLSLSFLLHLLKQHGILPALTSEIRYQIDTHTKTYRFSKTDSEITLLLLSQKFSTINCDQFHNSTVEDLLFHYLLYFEDYYHIAIVSKKSVFSNRR